MKKALFLSVFSISAFAVSFVAESNSVVNCSFDFAPSAVVKIAKNKKSATLSYRGIADGIVRVKLTLTRAIQLESLGSDPLGQPVSYEFAGTNKKDQSKFVLKYAPLAKSAELSVTNRRHTREYQSEACSEAGSVGSPR